MKEVKIYTDGACSGNPGAGGWGTILDYMGKRKELSGKKRKSGSAILKMNQVIGKETVNCDLLRNFIG